MSGCVKLEVRGKLTLSNVCVQLVKNCKHVDELLKMTSIDQKGIGIFLNGFT